MGSPSAKQYMLEVRKYGIMEDVRFVNGSRHIFGYKEYDNTHFYFFNTLPGAKGQRTRLQKEYDNSMSYRLNRPDRNPMLEDNVEFSIHEASWTRLNV